MPNDVLPVFDIPVRVTEELLPHPPKVSLAPEGTPLACLRERGYYCTRVPRLDVHAMVVFE